MEEKRKIIKKDIFIKIERPNGVTTYLSLPSRSALKKEVKDIEFIDVKLPKNKNPEDTYYFKTDKPTKIILDVNFSDGDVTIGANINNIIDIIGKEGHLGYLLSREMNCKISEFNPHEIICEGKIKGCSGIVDRDEAFVVFGKKYDDLWWIASQKDIEELKRKNLKEVGV